MLRPALPGRYHWMHCRSGPGCGRGRQRAFKIQSHSFRLRVQIHSARSSRTERCQNFMYTEVLGVVPLRLRRARHLHTSVETQDVNLSD